MSLSFDGMIPNRHMITPNIGNIGIEELYNFILYFMQIGDNRCQKVILSLPQHLFISIAWRRS
jgi:hypothetical protein